MQRGGGHGTALQIRRFTVNKVARGWSGVIFSQKTLYTFLTTLRHNLVYMEWCHILQKKPLLNASQHGFLKARSCLTNLLCVFEEITKWVDNEGSPEDVIYFDFQKAFDKVPHQRLILELKSHGMGNSIINWIEQWLTDRRQRVVVDG